MGRQFMDMWVQGGIPSRSCETAQHSDVVAYGVYSSELEKTHKSLFPITCFFCQKPRITHN